MLEYTGLGVQRSLAAGLSIPDEPSTFMGPGEVGVIGTGDGADVVDTGLIGTVVGA